VTPARPTKGGTPRGIRSSAKRAAYPKKDILWLAANA